MSAILNVSINLDKIPADAKVKGKKGTYVNLTVIANDKLDNYGNQVSASISQSKEEREAGEAKVYLGNGNVAWVSPEGVSKIAKEGDDLPF